MSLQGNATQVKASGQNRRTKKKRNNKKIENHENFSEHTPENPAILVPSHGELLSHK